MTAAHPSLDAHHSPDTGHTLQTSPSPQVHSSSSRIYTPSPQAAHSPDPSLKNTYVLVSTPDGAVDTQSGAVEFWACARMDLDATARNRAMERNMVSGFVRLECTEIYIYIYMHHRHHRHAITHRVVDPCCKVWIRYVTPSTASSSRASSAFASLSVFFFPHIELNHTCRPL